jgi:hypothetical protein
MAGMDEPALTCACSVVGLCSRCREVVCWGHHRNVEAEIAVPTERLRETLRRDPMFAERCDREVLPA